ncbi:hypothetical protein CLOP_g18032, partial [Closterium sp. NIES-67]
LSAPVPRRPLSAQGRVPVKGPLCARRPAGTRGPALTGVNRRRVDLRQPAASRRSPPGPALGANPFPEVTDPFCRLPLPTLIH